MIPPFSNRFLTELLYIIGSLPGNTLYSFHIFFKNGIESWSEYELQYKQAYIKKDVKSWGKQKRTSSRSESPC